MKLSLALFLALFTVIFSPAASFAAGFSLPDIVRAAPADLTAGLLDANNRGDAFASQCYAGIIAYNDAHPQATGSGLVKPIGPVTAFQTARDVVKGVQNPADFIPKELVSACGALALDVQGDLGKVAVKGGLLGLGL